MDDNQQTLDLDAMLAIVRKRTQGTEWLEGECILRFGFVNTKAIVAAVNNFEAIAERCKRAEVNAKVWKENAELAAKSCVKAMEQRDELTRQRDELLAALKDIANECPINNDIRLKGIASLNSVKGGADGKA